MVLAAHAAEPRVVKVGVIGYATTPELSALRAALARELAARQRPDIRYEVEAFATPYDEKATLAAVARLRALGPDVVLLTSPILVDYVLHGVDRVPVVTTGEGFLSEMPFFASVAKPGGRVTGFLRSPSSLAKRVELLQGFCPRVRRVGYLADEAQQHDEVFLEDLRAENERLAPNGAVVIPLYSKGSDIVAELPRIVRERGLDALDIGVSPAVLNGIAGLEAALEALRLPHVYSRLTVMSQGGALAAQPVPYDVARMGAEYIARIAQGESPSEIPVQISRAYDIGVNVGRIKSFAGCDPRRVARIATRFYP
jgi:putative ABC transport system substrate-binding protein